MENGLYRKESLERISSPEELHEYMRVTSPRLWMLLSAIVAMLVGVVVYASTVTMESTMPIKVMVSTSSDEGMTEDGSSAAGSDATIVSSTLPLSQKGIVETGMTVRFGSEKGKITWMAEDAESDEFVVLIKMEHEKLPLPDGEYDAELVLEETTPISFLWN